MTGETIRKNTRDERSYRYAAQLCADGRVKALRVEGENVFSALVEDPMNRARVRVTLQDGQAASCRCSVCAGAPDRLCAHLAALLLELSKSGRLQALLSRARREAAARVLGWFEAPTAKEPSLRLHVTLLLDETPAKACLRVGVKRLYMVKDLAAFLKSYQAGQEVVFGKNLQVEPQWQCFPPAQERVAAFLAEAAAARELALGRPSLRERALPLTPQQLRRLLQLLAASAFTLQLDGEEVEVRGVRMGDVPAHFTLRSLGKELELEAVLPEDCRPLTPDAQFVLVDGQAVGLSAAQQRALRPFLCRGGRLRCRFTQEEGERLVSEVVPALREVAQVTLEESVNARIVREKLTVSVRLDLAGGDVTAQVAFLYGPVSIDPFAPPAPREQNALLLRESAKEKMVLDLLGRHGFKVRLKEAYLAGSEAIYSFLKDGVPLLQASAEVYCSKDLLRIRPRRVQPKGKLRMSGDGDLLQFELLLDGVPKSAYEGVLQALRERKSYVRLKDGAFLSLLPDDGWPELADYLGEVGQVKGGMVEMMRCRAAYLSQLLSSSSLPIQQDEAVASIASAIACPTQEKPPLKGLRPYQARGFNWLRTLAQLGLGGILADDMGLGKTLQVLALIQWGRATYGPMPSVVVAPTSLLYNWQAEAQKFAPKLTTLVLEGGQSERRAQGADLAGVDVLILSYAQARRDVEWLKDKSFRYCVLDEAQHIKNASSVGAAAVKQLRAQSRFALTGTPMENHLGELWSIFDFVLPGYLMDLPSFLARHGEGGDTAQLARKIRPFLLRRLKRDVLSELPEKIEHRIVAELTPEQRKVYLATLAKVRGEVDEAIQTQGWERAHFRLLAAITRLRQICCHPSLFLEGYEGGSGKMELALELIGEQAEGGHRILLFSQFTAMLGLLGEQLQKAGIPYLYLDGATPAQERLSLTQRFNGGEAPVFLISLRAGGYGLNLTGADTVIHYDPWWNPAVEEQATDRAHRIGQQKAVHVIRLIARDTIEEKVVLLQQSKKALIDQVVTPGEVLPSALSAREIRSLFD